MIVGKAPATLAIGDPLAVFAFLLRNVPERAQVYPTENYYYFRFVYKDAPYTGNIRLAAADRDSGKVHFAYGERRPTGGRPDGEASRARCIAWRRAEQAFGDGLSRGVSGQGGHVRAQRSGRGQAARGLLRADETFLGPIFDESSVRFFLVFNTRLKIFHYLLDETVAPADEWTAAGDGILIGKRTGFAFYRDGGRKILIGVNERSSRLNTISMGRSINCRRTSSKARRCATRSSPPIPPSKARSTGWATISMARAAI